MAIAIVIIIVLLTLAHFYLKCSMMTSFSTMLSAVISSILAFTYYEYLAELFVSRGYGVNWAQFGCFILTFILAFALLRALSDMLVGANVDVGKTAKVSSAVICGLLTGLIISGNLLVAMGMLPMHGKMFYSRFDPEGSVQPSNPKTPAINADGFAAGLFSWVSRGSLSSKKSFGVLHADYLSQIHLNRLKIKEDVLSVTSRKSLILPSGKTKKPVRTWDIPDEGKLTVVRAGIVAKAIPDGGANNGSGNLTYFPAQIRMICKQTTDPSNPLGGSGKAVYPVGVIVDGKLVKSKPDEIITPETKGLKDRTIWSDLAFKVPSGHEPVLLQFKNNAVIELPKAVATSDEIEEALDSKEEKKPNEGD